MRNIIVLAISLLLAFPAVSLAEVVGHLTQVEGRVELLKGGKLPATEAKAQDGVEPGDVLRTKSLSRAQITFMDNTTVTISPESRIAVEEYMFDPAKKKRSVVMQLFQGLAHFVVSQVYKVQEPDFIVKTHTGVMGVRGTDVGIRLTPNDTTFLCFKGLVRVANIFPEVGDTFKRAEKTAFAFGHGFVDLNTSQGTVVARGLPPTIPFTITDQDRQLFMQQLQYGPLGRLGHGGFTGGPDSNLAGTLPTAVSPALTNRLDQIMNNLAITPVLAATQSTSPSLAFSQTFGAGSASLIASATTTFSGSFASISRSVAYPGTFTNNLLNLTINPTSGTFFTNFGSMNVTSNTFKVTGPTGGTLTGTGAMQISAVSTSSVTYATFNLTGPVTIAPGGAMTFTAGAGSTVTQLSSPATGTVTGSLTSH